MAIEIERKFLVRDDSWRASVEESRAIRQGYLSTSAKATVRIRVYDNAEAFLTLKGPADGISRSEFEYPVPLDDGRELLEMSRPHVVEKRRHHVRHGGLLWEVDVFEGAHEGLVIAEVELEHAEQAVDLPGWVGQEVSDDDRYANASLSRHPGVPTPR